jgi:uncharacterized membrane protein
MMKPRKSARRVITSVALAATLALLPATASIAQAQGPRGAGFSVPVTGTATDANGVVQTLTGTVTIQRFTKAHKQVFAQGTLVGTVTSATPGGAARTVVTPVSVPVFRADAIAPTDAIAITAVSCNILHLVLGPLDLDLLGLVVHLDQVVLDITAVADAGNLLGNLLCAITGLLDGGATLANLVALLNTVLGLLG